ncbi:SDR family oxidoreductase sniffer isoform X2 [Megalopta genalis]|uniref:SDR family oxidoreductase sniffer isoform X2 n=1 Tax=Megalopta genalis TaxID=115081 RepID=UPI001442F6AC|nr:C-factor isoform X2 [Megalopta genalis]XP_033340864.1 C-factor isoform X2 [Megalopta genalis]
MTTKGIKSRSNKYCSRCRDMKNFVVLISTGTIVSKQKVHYFTDPKDYDKIVKTVSEKVDSDGLNVLFNNAGFSPKFTRLNLMKEDHITKTFFINIVVPLMLTKAVLPLLKVAANKCDDKTHMSVNRSAVINMSSLLGSIADNTIGGFYPYRCSKAALNAATKSMSIDFKDDGILVISLHPGWVRTNLGGSNAPIDVDTSVNDILNTLGTLTEEHTGCFIQHDGKMIPW